MCTLPTVGLMIGQSVLNTMEQNSAAKAQNKMYRQNAEYAGKAAADRGAQIAESFTRNTREIASNILDTSLGTLETVASAGVEAAASGTKGASSARVAGAVRAQGLREEASLRDQIEQIRYNAVFEGKGLSAETTSRINSVQRGQGTSLVRQLAVQGLSYGANQILSDKDAGKTKLKIPKAS